MVCHYGRRESPLSLIKNLAIRFPDHQSVQSLTLRSEQERTAFYGPGHTQHEKLVPTCLRYPLV